MLTYPAFFRDLLLFPTAFSQFGIAVGRFSLSRYRDTAFTKSEQVIAGLAKETSVQRVADFSKRLEAAKLIDGKNTERRNYWGELAIWSARRMGELIRDGQKEGRIAGKGGDRKSKFHDGTLILKDVLGVDGDSQAKHISARAQKLADVPAKVIREYTRQELKAGGEVGRPAVPDCFRRGDHRQLESVTPPESKKTGRPVIRTAGSAIVGRPVSNRPTGIRPQERRRAGQSWFPRFAGKPGKHGRFNKETKKQPRKPGPYLRSTRKSIIFPRQPLQPG